VIEVRTQAQLDKAVKRKDVREGLEAILIQGNGSFVFTEAGSPRVETWGQSSPRVVTRGQSSPRVETWGQSSPRVVTWEQSSPRVVTREQSSPRVVTREQSSPRVETWEQSSPRVVTWEQSSPRVVTREQSSPRVVTREQSSPRVETWEQSVVTGSVAPCSRPTFWKNDSSKITIPGAIILKRPELKTAKEWCDFYGVQIRKGGSFSKKLAGQDVAILFKALAADFTATGGFRYEPGTAPEAPDWDGGTKECGGGLHFSPHPVMASDFNSDPEHFVACPVLLSEIVLHPNGLYPQKVKAPRCCGPVWEVDEDGEKIDG
jgi:hypothetical protein